MRSVLYYYDTSVSSFSPVELPARIQIVDVAVGSDHVVVVTSEHIVFAFGDGSRGQLGLGTSLT